MDWCSVSLLNLHEDVRSQPAAWVPVGWIPNYDESLSTERPSKGYESDASRKANLFHECFRLLLKELVDLKGPLDLTWGDGVNRRSVICLGGFIGDQQETDRVACQAQVCHRCHVKRADFLETKVRAPRKTTWEMKQLQLEAAAGSHSRGRAVVEWDADGRRRAGPGVKSYDRIRKMFGHLVRNAFWAVPGFCIYSMCMRDPMHQIDHGVIVFLLRAILWRYMETVEKQLGLAAGTAVTKLTARINMVLGKRKDDEGRTFKGMHDTLIQVSKATRNAFEDIGKNVFKTPKLHSSVRATDVRHLLLLLPLICHNLFSSEAAQHNEQNRGAGPPVEDPSQAIVMVCIILLKWYHLYRSSDGHDSEDLAELDRLAIMFFEKCKEVFPYFNGVGNWIMGTDKVHFMLHAASEIMKWGSIINCSAEVVETNHKTWVKEQGQNTNQGASSAKTMMKNSMRKVASMELTQAMAGESVTSCIHNLMIDTCRALASIHAFVALNPSRSH